MASSRLNQFMQAGNMDPQSRAKQRASGRNLLSENARLEAQIRLLKNRILELERIADTDALIDIYNRRAFLREISRAQAVFTRYDIPSSLIYFDLNGFKSVNDRFGHTVGDELLKKIANVLVRGVRDCDMVARLGGDEFGVLLFKADTVIAKAKAATLSCRINEVSIDMPTGGVKVGASWGVCACDPDMRPERIIDRADRAMFMAKRG